MKFEQIKKTLSNIDDPVEKLEFVMEIGKELEVESIVKYFKSKFVIPKIF